MNNMGEDGWIDERDVFIDATCVDGCDIDDEEEERWTGPYDSVIHSRIPDARVKRLRRRMSP